MSEIPGYVESFLWIEFALNLVYMTEGEFLPEVMHFIDFYGGQL